MKFQTLTINSDDHGIRLDRFFKRHYKDISFATIAKLTRKKDIRINGKRAELSTKLNEGDELSHPYFQEKIESKPVVNAHPKLIKMIEDAVIFQDENIIVLNKPYGLAVQGGSKINVCVDDLAIYLKGKYEEKPKLVHRLDKNTSGLLVLARKANVATKIAKIIKEKVFHKTYLALCLNVPKTLSGEIDLPLMKMSSGRNDYEKVEVSSDGKDAITYYEVLDKASNQYCLIKAQIITGRTHQIRVHLSYIGCPIIGDDKYGSRTEVSKSFSDKLYLHAYKLEFNLEGKDYKFEAALPAYFNDALNDFGLSVKT